MVLFQIFLVFRIETCGMGVKISLLNSMLLIIFNNKSELIKAKSLFLNFLRKNCQFWYNDQKFGKSCQKTTNSEIFNNLKNFLKKLKNYKNAVLN